MSCIVATNNALVMSSQLIASSILTTKGNPSLKMLNALSTYRREIFALATMDANGGIRLMMKYPSSAGIASPTLLLTMNYIKHTSLACRQTVSPTTNHKNDVLPNYMILLFSGSRILMYEYPLSYIENNLTNSVCKYY